MPLSQAHPQRLGGRDRSIHWVKFSAQGEVVNASALNSSPYAKGVG